MEVTRASVRNMVGHSVMLILCCQNSSLRLLVLLRMVRSQMLKV